MATSGLRSRYEALPEARRQVVQFIGVGFTSIAIDWTLTWLFLYHTSWPWSLADAMHFGVREDVAHWVAKAAAVSVATLNGFWWNSRYTFAKAAVGNRRTMLARFYVVILLGVVFNATLLTLFLAPFDHPKGLLFWGAQALATLMVTVWNFIASKRWVFRA